MHSDDLAYAIKYCLDNDIHDNMNISVNENLSITEMTQIALKACDAEYIEIEYDTTKPNGQYRKDVSVDLLKEKYHHLTLLIYIVVLKNIQLFN